MSILVTGGAGFIGSHTCLNLLEKGYEVYVIDSFINSSPESLKRVMQIYKRNQNKLDNKLNLYKGDLRNKSLLEEVFTIAKNNGNNIEGVIHFAGLKSVKESIKEPLLYWDSNVNSSLNLLEAMKNNHCHTIVFSSSATIYGNVNANKIKESCRINPINPYGNTKAVIESLLSDVYASNESLWRVANLRYFNPIGAHSSGLIGENPNGIPNNIFPFITNVALGNLSELKVFGNDWPTPDGTGVRDYIHVMDLADGHIKTLEYLLKNKPQIQCLNLGTGKGTSVLDLINSFQEVNEVKIPFEFSNRRNGDVAKLVADNSLVKSLINWTPKKSLIDMCRDGFKWQTLNPNGY